MTRLLDYYLKLYSFYLTTNKRTARGTYKAHAKNLSFSNCFITVFAWSTALCYLVMYLLVYLTNIKIGTTILNSTLLLNGGLTSFLAINFRTRYNAIINQLDKNPEQSNLDTITLNLIQITLGAIPLVLVSILYSLILGLPINW